DTDVKLWDWKSPDAAPRSLSIRPEYRFYALEFTADGRTLIGRCPSGDFGLHVWDVASGAMLKDWYGHRGLDTANNLAMHPDGQRIASTRFGETYSDPAERENGVYLWNLESGRLEKSFTTPNGVARCGFSPDGRWLVAKSERGAHVWDLQTGREVADDPEAH